MEIHNIYTSIGCNRTPQSLDWGNNGYVLFAGSHAVIIYDPNYHKNSSKILHTYVEHKARVNTVKWIKPMDDLVQTEFISGSNDSTCIIWNIKDILKPTIQKIQLTDTSVTVIDGIYTKNSEIPLVDLIVVTGSTDSMIRIWHRYVETTNTDCSTADSLIQLKQTISLNNGLCFSIKMCYLPNTNNILLTTATDDCNIHLYSNDGISTNELADHDQFVLKDVLIGHEDWVRCLDIIETDTHEILLASSSQDTFIRLWKISSPRLDAISNHLISNINVDGEIQLEERIFTVNAENNSNKQCTFAITLESVLLGHDGWVYGVHWNKNKNGILQLLSSSIDKTLIIWQQNVDENNIWMEKIRVGEIGGNSLGFYGGKFSKTGESIIGHGYQGSFHIWHQSLTDPNIWTPGIIIGGHFDDVRDIGWEQHGHFLYSLSADQTTRIHGQWCNDENVLTWHELARPQIHGYDMQCLSVLPSFKFASGAEEKIVRTFQAPSNFIENLQHISRLSMEHGLNENKLMPQGASVPSLGLSNKAVFENTLGAENVEPKHVKDQYPENYFTPIALNVPPSEETLMQNTLWPEIQKLYGHGYDIYALCSTSNGQILASSCRATTNEHAQIILWNTSTWKQIQKLQSHQLTVTQMKFSPNNQYLLSVSRDRRWSIFENQSTTTTTISNPDDVNTSNYILIGTTDKKNGLHTRIIWTCDWSHDSKLFVTGSRDGKIIIWYRSDVKSDTTLGYFKSIDNILEFTNQSVTALAFHCNYYQNKLNNYLLAIGFESGQIFLYHFNQNYEWKQLIVMDKQLAHHLTVKKLEFRPSSVTKQINNNVQLASCGEDHLVRIYEVDFTD